MRTIAWSRNFPVVSSPCCAFAEEDEEEKFLMLWACSQSMRSPLMQPCVSWGSRFEHKETSCSSLEPPKHEWWTQYTLKMLFWASPHLERETFGYERKMPPHSLFPNVISFTSFDCLPGRVRSSPLVALPGHLWSLPLRHRGSWTGHPRE